MDIINPMIINSSINENNQIIKNTLMELLNNNTYISIPKKYIEYLKENNLTVLIHFLNIRNNYINKIKILKENLKKLKSFGYIKNTIYLWKTSININIEGVKFYNIEIIKELIKAKDFIEMTLYNQAGLTRDGIIKLIIILKVMIKNNEYIMIKDNNEVKKLKYIKLKECLRNIDLEEDEILNEDNEMLDNKKDNEMLDNETDNEIKYE